MKHDERRILTAILDTPTAPFHEHAVRATVATLARDAGLTVRRDRFGNLYLGYRRGRARPVAFTAHLDHPGFTVEARRSGARGRLLGGVPASALAGARLRLFVWRDRRLLALGKARVRHVRAARAARGRRPTIHVDLETQATIEPGTFAQFDVGPVRWTASRLAAPALDNLVSTALILLAMRRLAKRHLTANVLGVFTRAEEVGFVGAGGVLRSRVLPASTPVVVLEASKARYEVRRGAGPVVRVGDRMTSFSAAMDAWLSERAAHVQRRRRSFRWQRALMTGGACEASLYMVHGRRVGALAIPLGNYHNVTPGGRVGAEYVHPDDVARELDLLEDLAAHPPDDRVLREQRRRLDAVFTSQAGRLEDETL